MTRVILERYCHGSTLRDASLVNDSPARRGADPQAENYGWIEGQHSGPVLDVARSIRERSERACLPVGGGSGLLALLLLIAIKPTLLVRSGTPDFGLAYVEREIEFEESTAAICTTSSSSPVATEMTKS